MMKKKQKEPKECHLGTTLESVWLDFPEGMTF
jgi:hypothetical protein